MFFKITYLLLFLKWELSTKLVLNAVSTGAHILKGKIYQNHMIDVQVTNSKLYRRATRLLQVSRRMQTAPELHYASVFTT